MKEIPEFMRAHVAEVEAGTRIWPDEFSDRCAQLRKRGLSMTLSIELCHTGDLALLKRVEAATDADIGRLNAAWLK